MNRSWIRFFTIFLISCASQTRVVASGDDDSHQAGISVSDTSGIYKFELRDGSTFFGHIASEDVSRLQLVTLSGNKMDLKKSEIVQREQVSQDDFVNGRYWFKNPHPTRYLFGPSAFNLKKSEGYYQNTYLTFNSCNYGVTDHFSVGGGIELLSTFANGSGGPIFFLTPKFGFQAAPKLHLGAGVLFVSVPSISEAGRTGLGIGYGIATYGTTNSNLSAGLGWGFVKGDFSAQPILTISGMHRISRKAALVSENWLIPTNTYYGIYSYGIRFFGEKIAVDLAFLNNRDIADFLTIGIPYLDFVVKF